jgi:DNA-directed RNA polymerase subunit RPC12/RpoP
MASELECAVCHTIQEVDHTRDGRCSQCGSDRMLPYKEPLLERVGGVAFGLAYTFVLTWQVILGAPIALVRWLYFRFCRGGPGQ